MVLNLILAHFEHYLILFLLLEETNMNNSPKANLL